MTDSQAERPRIQINMRQVIGGSILIGIGGVIGLAGMAMAGTALVSAYRERIRQMDVPPTVLARQNWERVKSAANAGYAELRNGRHPADVNS